MSKETLRQLVEAEGRAVFKAMQHRAEPLPLVGCRLPDRAGNHAGLPGLRRRESAADHRRREEKAASESPREAESSRPQVQALPRLKAGADNAYKEFKVGYLYDEPKEHWLCGRHGGQPRSGRSDAASHGQPIALAAADERIALIDGAPWIRNQIEFHGLTQTSAWTSITCRTTPKRRVASFSARRRRRASNGSAN